jgi:transcriptional regulator with XRE-family HTH domain
MHILAVAASPLEGYAEHALHTLRQSVGRRIRDLREARGLTREQLGDLIDLDKAAIGRIERGERMNFDNLGPVAEALGVHVRSLFEFEQPVGKVEPLSKDAWRIALLVDRRAVADPTFAKRVLKILREI